MQGLDCLVTALTCMCRWMRRGRLWERRRCPLPSCTAGICSRSVDAWHQASKQWQKKAVRVQAFKPQTLVFAGHQARAAAAASLVSLPFVRKATPLQHSLLHLLLHSLSNSLRQVTHIVMHSDSTCLQSACAPWLLCQTTLSAPGRVAAGAARRTHSSRWCCSGRPLACGRVYADGRVPTCEQASRR